jgi:hypothetical protein
VAGAGQPGGSVPVSLAITSVSPRYARPGRPVTVSGTLTNISGATMTGLSIQLRTSPSWFTSRGELQEYANGALPGVDSPLQPNAVTALTRPLAPRATAGWSITLHASQLPMTSFGVYPLAAEADSTSQGSLVVSRTFLPFWPGKQNLGDPRRQDVAWIWPLIDQPRQTVCAGLLNNGLAASFGHGGRLAALLAAGRSYSSRAHLTWVIDPALLASAAKMSKSYQAGGIAGCHGTPERASRAASGWLGQLRSATAGHPLLLTPYDDADITALARYGLTADLDRAFTDGRLIAAQALGRSFSAAAAGTSAATNAMAWPADGLAGRADLAALATTEGITTVVLDSSTMPPVPQQNYTPSAQVTVPVGSGSDVKVLLSDETITQLIGSATAGSASAATRFSVQQRYLAETAMIAAEQPGLARSIVVAPPRRWDPPASLASGLLADTVTAPWLRPVSLAALAAVRHPAGQVTRQVLPRRSSSAHLGRSLVSQVRQLDEQASLLKSIELAPAPGLVPGPDRALFAIESSAWRGSPAGQRALAQQVSADVARQEGKLKILVTQREQLTGRTGTVPVSISNRLNEDVRVRLQADPGGGVTVRKQPRTLTVPAGEQVIVRLQVTATAVGSSTLLLSLLTPGGTPIPGARASMTIQATHYGTLALVIIAAVLGVFMISSGVRTLRRRGRRAREAAASPDPAASAAEPQDGAAADADGKTAGPEVAAAHSEWNDRPEKTDTVMSDRIKTGQITGGHDPSEGEGTDDYAWTPGWTDRR